MQVVWEHTRLVVAVQDIVSILPLKVHAAAQAEQMRLEVAVHGVDSYVSPVQAERHVEQIRSELVVHFVDLYFSPEQAAEQALQIGRYGA